jgi:hypothetical protein
VQIQEKLIKNDIGKAPPFENESIGRAFVIHGE